MTRVLSAAVLIAALGVLPARAAVLTSVENVGSIFNESLALPAEDTPGSGIGFAQFFEFSLPTRETVTVSMSDSGIGNLAVVGGVLSLNTQTSTGPGPLFTPLGAFLESSPVLNVVGGQEAIVSPDILNAGNYFVALTGTSGSSPIHLAIDGTVTAQAAVPEPSTWAMILLGFAGLAFIGGRSRRASRTDSIVAAL
jgi:hypothetical protein